MKKFSLIVTRHQGLVDYLKELGLCDESVKVLQHASADDVRRKHVCGVLPHNLSCLTKSFSEVSLDVPFEKRGKELTLEEVKEYQRGIQTYRVLTEEDFQRGLGNVAHSAYLDGCGCANVIDWEHEFFRRVQKFQDPNDL